MKRRLMWGGGWKCVDFLSTSFCGVDSWGVLFIGGEEVNSFLGFLVFGCEMRIGRVCERTRSFPYGYNDVDTIDHEVLT